MLRLSTQIEAVTVFRRGARIRRVAELRATGEGGLPDSLRLGGLPLSLDDSSVRIRLEGVDGNGAGPPVANDLRVVLEVPDADRELPPAIDAELEDARHEEALAIVRVQQLEDELGRLAALEPVPRPAGAEGEPPGESPVAARSALVRFRGERELAVKIELSQARKALKRAKRLRKREEDRHRRASNARQAREHELRKAALVTLKGGGAAERVRVVLEYQVPGACWAPAYALHLDSKLSSAKLLQRALVAQRTGEDWADVAVTLSTAEAEAWTELPELASQRIGRRQPPAPKRGWRPPPVGAETLYGDWDRAFGDLVPKTRPAATVGFEEAVLPELEAEAAAEERVSAHETFGVPSELVAQSAPDGMPPPGGMPAPAPIDAPLSAPMRAKSAGPARAVAAAAAAPVALAARGVSALLSLRESEQAPERRYRGGPSSPTGFGPPQQAAAPLPPPPPPELTPGDLLRYGDLRMPSPRSAGRGRLVLASRHDLYVSLLVEQHIQVTSQVVAIVDAAERKARGVGEKLPPGHTLAWSDNYDYAYEADAPVHIPADGEFHAIPLGRSEADASPLYVVVPRESTDVFRTIRVDNPLEAPLLPGPVDVYLGGDFLLTVDLRFTAPRGRFTLGLGVEQGIKVARNTRFREESAGLMGGRLSLHHHVAIEVTNALDRPARLEVRERLPVTREDEDDIDLVIGEVTPVWEDWEPEAVEAAEPELRGGHRWRLTVPAGGQQELNVDYEIRLSSKDELLGGNRREG